MGIRNKLLLVIGDCSINQWARDRELPPQTVHGWIDKDRVPRKGGMETLVKATGIPEQWWLHGDEPPPATAYKNYPVSNAQKLTIKSYNHSQSSLIDTEILAYVIETIELTLDKRKQTLDAVRKAALIQLLYDYCIETGKRDTATVERFLKLAG